MLTIVWSIVAPPVPTSIWIEYGASCLRVEHDDVVHFSYSIVACMHGKHISNVMSGTRGAGERGGGGGGGGGGRGGRGRVGGGRGSGE